MSISLDSLEKVELTGAAKSSSIKEDDTLTAIFKVKLPNYIPAGVNPRARISAKMFTGSFKSEQLKKLEADENVESVSLSRQLRMIE